MSESELKELVEVFLEEFNKLKLMDDVAIRKPPSKHQDKLRQLCDMVRAFEAAYYLKHAEASYILKNEGTKDE